METPGRPTTPRCPLRISATVSADHTLVELDGEVDVESVPVLQAGLEVVTSESSSDVVIDLERLSFLSADGLWALVKKVHRLEAQDRRVEFRRPSPQVCKMLEWTGGPLRVVVR